MIASGFSSRKRQSAPIVARLKLPARRTIVLVAGSLLFSLVYQVPDWPALFQRLYGYPMIDRSVYERMIDYYDLPVDYIESFTVVTYFTQEFLWNFALAYLNRDLGLTTDQIFYFISTLVLWRFSYEVAQRVGWLYSALLVNPLVVDLAFSQLRIALAISIMSFLWRGTYGRLLTVVGYLVCTSIHTSSILFGVMHLVANKIDAPSRKGLVALCVTGLMIAVAIGPLKDLLLGSINDRRVEASDMSSSPLYLSYWIFFWGMLVVRWKSTMYSFDSRYALIILSIAASNLLFTGYPTRFIAVAFPYLIIAMYEPQWRPLRLLIPAFVPYMAFQWMYWFLLI